MRESTKIGKLKLIIDNNLREEIDSQYALFDLPFHTNIGDGLIWEGEVNFLNDLKCECQYSCSYFTCSFPDLTENTTILFHGGGNFGDLYHEHIEFLQKIIKMYPNNKIIVLPQTVFYKSDEVMKMDMQVINSHKNIILCARDARSYNLLSSTFVRSSTLRMVPDMAFYIPSSYTTVMSVNNYVGNLAILRTDGELKKGTYEWLKQVDAKIEDWPTFNHNVFDGTFTFKSIAKLVKLGLLPKYWLNQYCERYFHSRMLHIGISFLSKYDKIYTTRLHGCILSILMGKEVYLLDNSYGKNYSFYETWLKDFDNVHYIQV